MTQDLSTTALRRLAVLAAALAVIPGGAAYASCSNRPGTPNDVRAEAVGPHAITFSWRNTVFKGMNRSGTVSTGDTPMNIWADIYVRDGQTRNIGRDETGTGPFSVVYGERSSQTFSGLNAAAPYCFAIRARSDRGTQGCISEQTSAWACATTLPAGAPTQPGPKPLGKPHISVSGSGSFTITGDGFQPNRPVYVRVVGASHLQTALTTAPARSDADGKIDYHLRVACGAETQVIISATDGRPDVYSNYVHAACTQ